MEKEQLFARGLEQIKKTAMEQGNYVTKEQVEEVFASLQLGDAQFQMIYEYLKKSRIGIGRPPDDADYMTVQEQDYLKIYLEELTLLPQLDPGELEAVTMSAMAGDSDARQRLIESYLHNVTQIARLYAGQGVFLEDLIGEGNVALANGVMMAGCLESASEFPGMIGRMIMEAMEELIREDADNRKKDQKAADRVNMVMEKAKELSADLRRKVTVTELADETKLSVKTIMDAVQMSGFNQEYIEVAEDAETGL